MTTDPARENAPSNSLRDQVWMPFASEAEYLALLSLVAAVNDEWEDTRFQWFSSPKAAEIAARRLDRAVQVYRKAAGA